MYLSFLLKSGRIIFKKREKSEYPTNTYKTNTKPKLINTCGTGGRFRWSSPPLHLCKWASPVNNGPWNHAANGNIAVTKGVKIMM